VAVGSADAFEEVTMTLFNSAEVEQVLLPNVRDLGDGFQVRRALPSAQPPEPMIA
jgi:hypothetical protein